MQSDFIRQIAINTATPKDVVEKIIKHSLSCFHRSMREVGSAEITGFGTFHIKENRIVHFVKAMEGHAEKLDKYLEKDISPVKRKHAEDKRRETLKNIETLKKRYGLE